jgi:hypothetical protein
MPALDLYQGGGIPEIRAYIGNLVAMRQRTFILSARYGLLGADDLIESYDAVLTLTDVLRMRASVWAEIQRRILTPHRPSMIFVLAEPLYFALAADLLEGASTAQIIWEPDIHNGLERMIAKLDIWRRQITRHDL